MFNTSAIAEYGSNQFMINIGGGMPMEIAQNQFITPNAAFQYTLVENETYSERGAGNLNLRVDQDEAHVAMGIFGLRYHTNRTFESGTLIPELRGGITYDFAADDGVSTNVFNGGGAVFENRGADVAEFGYRLGGGLSYQLKAITLPFLYIKKEGGYALSTKPFQGLSVSANYDLWKKEDFVGHSANVSIRFEF